MENPRGKRTCILVATDAVLQDGEFVSAETRERIAAFQQSLQALRHLKDQGVAGLVAVGVIHLLETVEIEEHQREALLLLASADLIVQPLQGQVEGLAEKQPVRQTRKRILTRERFGARM